MEERSRLRGAVDANAEWLSKLKRFVVDKGPELVGDLINPWAKWALILLTSVGPSFINLFIALVPLLLTSLGPSLINLSVPNAHPIKSTLQIIGSDLRAAAEDVLENAEDMAKVRFGALAVCRAIIVMLIIVMGDFGWKWLIGFHIAFFVARTNLEFSKEVHDLFFQAIHVFLYILNAVSPTFFCQFLLTVVGSLVAISLLSSLSTPLIKGFMFLLCVFVGFFCTPLWFGVCVLFAILVGGFAYLQDLDMLYECIKHMCPSFCIVRLVEYASGGGCCGALIACLLPIVLLSYGQDPQAMVAPLPLVCALISCFYTPFWVGLWFTSMVIYTLATANVDNVKAIMVWWFVSFSALHLLSYAFSGDFSIVAMSFMGSYLSYVCII